MLEIHNVDISSKVFSFVYTQGLLDDDGKRQNGTCRIEHRLIEIDNGMPALDTIEAALHEVAEAGTIHASRREEDGETCYDIDCIVHTLAATMVTSPDFWEDMRELANLARKEEQARG